MSTKAKQRPQRGQVIELDIDRLAYGGRGIGRLDGYVVFVPYTAPGDRVKARVYKSKSSHGEANLLEIVRPSESRIDALCPLFTRCGGCSWQHLPMDVQEHWKADIVAGALRQVKGLDPADVILDPIVSSPNPFHYRNKMEFTFGQEGPDAPLKIGFHMPGNWKHILDVEQCWLHPQPFEALLTAAREEGVRQGLSSWNPMRHEGMLRQLVVRWSEYEQRALVAILTGAQKGFDFQAFVRALTEACPQVKGIVWGLNSGRSDVARAEDVIETWGEDVLEEHLGSLKFQISLASFFQTNTLGAVGLYSVAKDYLGLTGCERLLDAYCGTGTIGLFCADQAQHVYGIEVVRDAIWDARMNATRNGIENTTFMAGDMASTLPSLLGGIEGPVDRLVVDPPRSGMDKKALAQLVAIKAPVLVYVSCNPTTMARDLQQIFDGGYKIERLRPVDMFPQTYHIECVARCVLEP